MGYLDKVEDEASNLCVGLFGLILIGLWGIIFIPAASILIPFGVIGIVVVLIGVALERDWVNWVYDQDD